MLPEGIKPIRRTFVLRISKTILYEKRDPVVWFVCCLFGISFAQSSIEFIPQGGYTFADKLNFANSIRQNRRGI